MSDSAVEAAAAPAVDVVIDEAAIADTLSKLALTKKKAKGKKTSCKHCRPRLCSSQAGFRHVSA